ncbi:hypothetical protein C8R44DRAFT_750477 [Mycena epipterygia]|nr:hypothetical protein C8R44DRAFT_750477 [Mycena epipterygia]
MASHSSNLVEKLSSTPASPPMLFKMWQEKHRYYSSKVYAVYLHRSSPLFKTQHFKGSGQREKTAFCPKAGVMRRLSARNQAAILLKISSNDNEISGNIAELGGIHCHSGTLKRQYDQIYESLTDLTVLEHHDFYSLVKFLSPLRDWSPAHDGNLIVTIVDDPPPKTKKIPVQYFDAAGKALLLPGHLIGVIELEPSPLLHIPGCVKDPKVSPPIAHRSIPPPLHFLQQTIPSTDPTAVGSANNTSWSGWPINSFVQFFRPQQVRDTNALEVQWTSEAFGTRKGSALSEAWQQGKVMQRRCLGAIQCFNELYVGSTFRNNSMNTAYVGLSYNTGSAQFTGLFIYTKEAHDSKTRGNILIPVSHILCGRLQENDPDSSSSKIKLRSLSQPCRSMTVSMYTLNLRWMNQVLVAAKMVRNQNHTSEIGEVEGIVQVGSDLDAAERAEIDADSQAEESE